MSIRLATQWFGLSVLLAAAAVAQPAESEPVLTPNTGPMDISLQMIGDERRVYVGDAYPAEERLPTRFTLTLLLTGNRVGEIARMSEPVIEAMTDENGEPLINSDRAVGTLRGDPKPVEVPEMYIRYGTVPMQITMPLFPRTAQKIGRLKGFVNIVYGIGEQRVFVDELHKFFGKQLDHPDLVSNGIEAILLGPDEVRGAQGASFGLIFKSGEEKVKLVNGYDDWWRMLALRSQVGPGTIRDSKYRVYRPMRSQFNRDSDLVFIIYQELEEERLPFEFLDVELP